MRPRGESKQASRRAECQKKEECRWMDGKNIRKITQLFDSAHTGGGGPPQWHVLAYIT
jgi:hypothetical protein